MSTGRFRSKGLFPVAILVYPYSDIFGVKPIYLEALRLPEMAIPILQTPTNASLWPG